MYCLVSIHAPTRGATPLRCPFGTLTRCFNPRTHTGCDNNYVWRYSGTFTGFNPRTHTGCDNFLPPCYSHSHCFNPRTHTGCDYPLFQSKPPLFRFQSTHPHGVRRLLLFRREGGMRFNPRTHTGCDSVQSYIL